jgi:hypothetical protein
MRNEITQYALEAMEQYYTSDTPRHYSIIPELAVQTYCALKLQRSSWIVLTELCWESAVLTFGADPDAAGKVLPGKSRIDMIALPRYDDSSCFAIEIKRGGAIFGLEKDRQRLLQLAAAWAGTRQCTGILLLCYSFTHKEDLEKDVKRFHDNFLNFDPLCTDPHCFADPLNGGTGVHCAVASCLAIL